MSLGCHCEYAECPRSFDLRHRVRRMKRILKLAPSPPARVGVRVGDRTVEESRTSPSPRTRPGRCRVSRRKAAQPDAILGFRGRPSLWANRGLGRLQSAPQVPKGGAGYGTGFLSTTFLLLRSHGQYKPRGWPQIPFYYANVSSRVVLGFLRNDLSQS